MTKNEKSTPRLSRVKVLERILLVSGHPLSLDIS